jgi:hypothetical protein
MPDNRNEPNVSPIQARMSEAKLDFKSDSEIQQWKQGMDLVSGSAKEIKAHISKQPKPHEQMLFSFMPTSMTRTTPFFPMNKPSMGERPLEKLEWETSWGKMTMQGERLAVYDETVLLSLLVLVRKYRCETFDTSMSELCRSMGVAKGDKTFKAISGSLERLTGTKIKLELIEGKGKNRKVKMVLFNTILSGGKISPETGKLQVTVNPYFLQMYTESFITSIDLKFRNLLKGDITKALYRFYVGQRGDKYSCHILTLARAVNLNIDLPIRKIRDRIRRANRELKGKGYLSRSEIRKNDVLTIWKSNKLKTIS